MIQRLSFKNPRAGNAPRAAFYLRWARLGRRKRVAYARAQIADTMKALKRQIARYEALTRVYDVPVEPVAPLPPIPELPGREWIEYLRDMGALKEPVRPARNAEAATLRGAEGVTS